MIKKIYFFILTLLLPYGCNFDRNIPQKSRLDLPEIRENGILTAITSYNSTDYFIYRGEPMGFQYEMLKLFSQHIGLKLKVKVTNNMDKALQSVSCNNSSILAMGLAQSQKRREAFVFTEPFIQTRAVLVQRKPSIQNNITNEKTGTVFITKLKQLNGKTVVIQKGTVFHEGLKDIEKKTGCKMYIIEDNLNDPEGLIRKVAMGEIDYTVCDEHVALVIQRYYPNIDIRVALGPVVNLSWMIRKDEVQLLNEINDWMREYKKSYSYVLLYNKYFNNPVYNRKVMNEIYSVRKGIISPYDRQIRNCSKKLGWDWRLLASLIYQESQFDPSARSWTGAYGLMQMMPYNSSTYGLYYSSSDSNQIRAGVDYLVYLNKLFQPFIPRKAERIKFVLAAYNAGIGQIIDARMLAKKYGKNSYVWDHNVDTFVFLKSYPKYYLDPVTQYGYCRGIETYNFVNEIIDRYHHYANLVSE